MACFDCYLNHLISLYQQKICVRVELSLTKPSESAHVTLLLRMKTSLGTEI